MMYNPNYRLQTIAGTLMLAVTTACGAPSDLDAPDALDPIAADGGATSEEALRGNITGEKGFPSVGIFWSKLGRDACSGVMVAPDMVLTSGRCAKKRLSNFSPDGKWGDRWRVGTGAKAGTAHRTYTSDDDGLAIVNLDKALGGAPPADWELSELDVSQRLWVSGFGQGGGASRVLSRKVRRYAGAHIMAQADSRLTLEADPSNLICDNDTGSGVFSEDSEGRLKLVAIVLEAVANPGNSDAVQGCSQRFEAIKVSASRDWFDGLRNCPCRHNAKAGPALSL